ncbi:tRNA pseudouridine(13) synthase TruD [Guyparkeria sp.]|uniref:tRNA pseudouridine(13) synthase TruD n=1 Tax=Guyparkeria sp. TaxID=2035736 RepID=UPI003970CC92
MTDSLIDWPGAPGTARPRVAGAPAWQAGFKATPEAFRVDEDLGFEPIGAGNHWLVRLEKRDLTTGALVDRVAAITGTRPRDIGLCGLKDRNAVTSQWLSIPHETFDPETFEAACAEQGIGLLAMDRHDRKLRRGIHRANRFRLRLHDVTPRPGENATSLADYLAGRRDLIAARGFANYFGEQRYGRGFSNLEALREWGQGERRGSPKRAARTWLLSTLRSAIFDRVLADRLEQGTITTVLEGDILRLAGSRSRFLAEAGEIDALQRRLEAGDLCLTGPLWGETGTQAGAAVGERETELGQAMLERWGRESWERRLVQWRVEADRRPLTVAVPDLAFEIGDGTVTLSFSLPPGSYATELVAEMFDPLA